MNFLVLNLMATILRFKDSLDGESKFSPLKEHIVLLLEEVELQDLVEKVVTIHDKTIDVYGFTSY